MSNLLQETMEAIKDSGHSNIDIMFIGSKNGKYSCTWEQFQELARNLDYDSGYGAQHIAQDLVIVFEDGQQMTRGEYDGSEWWTYTEKFVMPTHSLPITNLGNPKVMWKDLEDLNPKPKNIELKD